MKYTTLLIAGFLCLSSVSCTLSRDDTFENGFRRLDDALSRADEYVAVKNQKISTIENMLHSRGVTPLQEYNIYGQLYDEYFAFQFDKAKESLEMQISIAEELGDKGLKDGAMLDKALLLTNAGFFLEASEVFDALDTLALDGQQMVSWYNVRQKFLRDYQEYVMTSDFKVPDFEKIKYYQDRILSETPPNSYMNTYMRILRMVQEREYEQAYEANLKFIRTLDPSSHDFAVQTYWQGFICDNLGKDKETIGWWIESAISDIKGAVKDNASLCSIATKLTDPEDTERAFKYIRISLGDALFYNAKLRQVQISSTMPWIQNAYTEGKEQQNKDRNMFLIITIAAACLLAMISVVTIIQYAKGKRTALVIEKKTEQLAEYNRSIVQVEDDLRKINYDLIEANAAKEEYLGLFLSMCSGYLDKLKKNLSRDQYEAELKTFYKTFDTSFLSLYPTFVEDFNALLKEEGRVFPKEGEMLNTELRIFALIKLGITQSSHIASLLRYSVNTIYNYRAQVKNAVLADRENFEDRVKKIGSRR